MLAALKRRNEAAENPTFLYTTPHSASKPAAAKSTASLVLKEMYESQYEPANQEKAIEHNHRITIRQRDVESGHSTPFGFWVSRKEIGKYGISLQLFFLFSSTITLMFLLMSIVAVVMMYFNYDGDGYADGETTNGLNKITLGNQGRAELENGDASSFSSYYKSIYRPQQDKSIVIQQVCHYCIVAIFALAYFYMRYRSHREKHVDVTENIAASSYAVEVDNIPASDGVTEDELKTHFENRFGAVAQCKVARDFLGTFEIFRSMTKYREEMRSEQARLKIDSARTDVRLNKLQKKSGAMEHKIRGKVVNKFPSGTFTFDLLPVIKAFVIFEDLKDARACIQAYAEFQASRRLMWWRKMPEDLKFRGKPITVKVPDQPTNIIWENLEYRFWARLWRQILSFFIILFVLIIGFMFNFVANLFKGVNLRTDCNGLTLTYDAAKAQASSSATTMCYCATQQYLTIIENSDLRTLCNSYILEKTKFLLMTLASAVLIIIIDIVLQMITKKLAAFQKYHTMSDKNRVILITYCISLFINVVCVPVIASANFFGAVPVRVFVNILKDSHALEQIPGYERFLVGGKTFMRDTNREWYTIVGLKITYAMFLFVISPHVFSFIRVPLARCMRRFKAKKCVIQKDINKVWTPPTFDITVKYASQLGIALVTLALCSGIPLLIPLCAVSFILKYWSDKLYVIRYSQIPPQMESRLNKMVMRALPIGLILHLAVTIWFFGCPDIWTYNQKESSDSELTVSNTDYDYHFWDRVRRSIISSVILCVVLAFEVGDRFLFKPFIRPLLNKNQIVPAEQVKTFGNYKDEFRKMDSYGLASYNIKKNSKYREIIDTMESFNNSQYDVVISPTDPKDLLASQTERSPGL